MEEEKKENAKSEVALREEKVLEFWREHNTFQKSLSKSSPKGNYVFYDGPPFATGKIHYGHILGSTAKDAIGRYQTMRGFHVPRKWGWDCHGLPIEHLVEKELGIAGHKEIEAYGLDKFVEYAKGKVLQYDSEWRSGIERIGRWVDFDGGYKTMDNTFMESVWWALSEFNKKGLIYEGVRVLAYCARCETPISNSEIAMDNSYKDIADISVYVKFELEDEPGTYLLAWTTTPWTLPGNTAIAVNKEVDYVKLKQYPLYGTTGTRDEGHPLPDRQFSLIISKNEFEKEAKLFSPDNHKVKLYRYRHPEFLFEIVGEFKGSELVGKRYKPVFPYYLGVDMPNKENVYQVWHADFITTEKGTGIAHMAPAFGEEDMDLARDNNIPWIVHVDETGRFKDEVADFPNLKVKPKDTEEDKDAHLRTDIEVIKYLQAHGSYFAKEKIMHSYPHCMRCDTPIIYYALSSWFVNIQKEKAGILENAKDMNWIPAHLKEGRFKNIVEGAPDWNISRNRYWATALPIWKCEEEECIKVEFVSSVDDLKQKVKKSGNKYFVMRHGRSEGNKSGLVSYGNQTNDHVTEEGKTGIVNSAKELKDTKIDLIITSNFVRTKETAEVMRKELGLEESSLIEDVRLIEMNPGDFDGGVWADYHEYVQSTGPNWFDRQISNGESLSDVKKRTAEVLYELEEKHKGKNILIVTHGAPAWLLFVNTGLFEPDHDEYVPANTHVFVKEFKRFDNAEVRELPFIPFPHDSNYNLDLHRPYIDEIKLSCSHSNNSGQACGGEMQRIPEVLDCWFESGSMPFAQDHYPFENPDWQKNNFPAGFVAEYIAQTRTWFYYTHAVSSILFGHAPFRNVVTTGTLQGEDGYKMSKSKNNFPDPWLFIDKYGVDALRLYLMSSPLMKGEDANFSEKLVQEIASKVIGRLTNTLVFYELYRDVEVENGEFSVDGIKNVLNHWILSRLGEVVMGMTKGMEAYDMTLATRPIEAFVDDLSTWYLRRSRDSIKNGDAETKQTLYFVLKTLARVMAPFAPFVSEHVWSKLRNEGETESVHLAEWPEAHGEGDLNILESMQITRDIVSLGLEARQRAGVKVRQPLSKLEVKEMKLSPEYIELIKEEINVKEVVESSSLEDEVKLDLNVTPELKVEGDYREFVRGVQGMRKDVGLLPSDVVTLFVATNTEGEEMINKFKDEFLKIVGASGVEFTENDGTEVKVDELIFQVKITK